MCSLSYCIHCTSVVVYLYYTHFSHYSIQRSENSPCIHSVGENYLCLAARRCFALSEYIAIVGIRFDMLPHFLHSSIEGPLGSLIGLAAGGVRDFFKGHGFYGPVLDFTVYQHCFPDRPAGIAEAQMLGNRALLPVGQAVVSLVQCVV